MKIRFVRSVTRIEPVGFSGQPGGCVSALFFSMLLSRLKAKFTTYRTLVIDPYRLVTVATTSVPGDPFAVHRETG